MPGITGYYRFTDIWFKYSKDIQGEDGLILSACLAHDALCAPDHPFHLEGVNGVQLWTATIVNGEERLLFSSAQIEYLRYWLYETKLTSKIIPAPRSDYLLVTEDLKVLTPVTFATGGDLRTAFNRMGKLNKNLKGSNASQISRRETFAHSLRQWEHQNGLWCSIDFEWWERDHTLITELGYALFYGKPGEHVEERVHFIIDENQYYPNGTYVPEHRYDYGFGKSQIISKKDIKSQVQQLFSRLRQHNGPCFLVFHGGAGDIKFLKSDMVQAPIDDLAGHIPTDKLAGGLYAVDTQDLFAALEGAQNPRSLERMGRYLSVAEQYSPFHNAGNDAEYTLLALKSMMTGGEVNQQRQARWGNAKEGVAVLESPDSDDEELYP